MSDRLTPTHDLAAEQRAADAGAPDHERDQYVPLDMTPDELNVVDYVKVVYKRRWAAGTVFLITLIGTLVYTFTTAPVFEARARLLIETDDPNVLMFAKVIEEGQPGADYYQTQYGILASRGLARRTIEQLGLWNAPALAGTPGDQGFSLTALARSAATFFGRDAVDATTPDETVRQSRVIDAFLASLSVEPVRNSRLVDVKFRSRDPVMAERMANGLARNYMQQSLEYRFTASQDATSWLAERLGEQRKQVEAAEAALQRYREQNDAISLEAHENIVVQKLTELNSAVTRAKTERLQKEATERQLRAIEDDPAALDTFPAVLGNAFIQRQKAELADLQRQQAQLSDRFGDRHPEMLKLQAAIQNSQLKLRGEIGKVVQAVHTDYEAAFAQERSLVTALEQQKSEALAMNRKAINYSVLARDVESGKQLYQSLLQRTKETGIAGELKTGNIRIVDDAERPRGAVTPNKRVNTLLGLLAGLVLAIGVAFFFEYIDSTLKSPEEVKACLGLPSLGMIPALGDRWTSTAPLLHTGVPPNFAEMIRGVRTNVLFSSTGEGTRTLVVTSTGPGEGKTLVASNLAVAMALAGQRVLLVDCDLRRSRVHELFGLDQEPGLSNVLVGNAKASEAVRKTEVAGLWVLPSGRTPPNPAELLSSKRFKDMVQSLGDHFDAVIIDTPPAIVVADPLVVASVASGVIFVVGAEMTSRHAARAALEQLHRGHVRILGAVLNRVQLERDWYYYSRYYRPEYAAYHDAPSSPAVR